MAKIADVLLMTLCSSEPNGGARFSAITPSIIHLLDNGEIDDVAIVSFLMNHHRHQQDQVQQQQQAARLLADLCFNRLPTLRIASEQLKLVIEKDTKDFFRTFCLELGK